MQFLRSLALYRLFHLFLITSFLVSHTPLMYPMMVALPQVLERVSNTLALATQSREASRQDSWIERYIQELMEEEAVLLLLMGNIARAHVATETSLDSTISANQLEHIERTLEQAPSSLAIYNILKAVQRTSDDVSVTEEIPQITTTQEGPVTAESYITPFSFAYQAPENTSIKSEQCQLGIHTPQPKPSAVEQIYEQKAQEAFAFKAQADHEIEKNKKLASTIASSGIAVVTEAGKLYKHAWSKLGLQKQEDERIAKMLKEEAALYKVYEKALASSVDILMQAHSPYSSYTQKNHALLALNHIALPGKEGRYLQEFVKVLNYYHFDADGSLKAVHAKSDYKQSVELLLPLFKRMARTEQEYHKYLESLEKAFVKESSGASSVTDAVQQIVNIERQKAFKRLEESDFTAIVYEMLPSIVQTWGKIEQQVVTTNEFNKEFIKVINKCLIDVTDPEQDPLDSFNQAYELIKACTDKKYAKIMSEYYYRLHEDTFMPQTGLPAVFKYDPCAIINIPKEKSALKGRIKYLAERYQVKKQLQKAFHILPSANEEVEKLLYAFIAPLSSSKKPGALSYEQIIDHLLLCHTSKRSPLSQNAFEQFFTPGGILKPLEQKVRAYPDLMRLEALVYPNKEILRYTNYFLALDAPKEQVSKGISYVMVAAINQSRADDYMKLAKAQYNALKGIGDTTILSCPNFAKTYKNAVQNSTQYHIISLVTEALTQEKAKCRYVLKGAHAAHVLTSYNRTKDAADLLLSVKDVLQKLPQSYRCNKTLISAVNQFVEIPGALDTDSLLIAALKKGTIIYEPELITKTKQALKQYTQVVATADLPTQEQKTLQARLSTLLKQAEKLTTIKGQEQSNAALHADLILRLCQQTHTLNVQRQPLLASALLTKYESPLVLVCESYKPEKLPHSQPLIKPPIPAQAKGICRVTSRPEPALVIGPDFDKAQEKIKQYETGKQTKESQPKGTCNAAAQSVPSFGSDESFVIPAQSDSNKESKPNNTYELVPVNKPEVVPSDKVLSTAHTEASDIKALAEKHSSEFYEWLKTRGYDLLGNVKEDEKDHNPQEMLLKKFNIEALQFEKFVKWAYFKYRDPVVVTKLFEELKVVNIILGSELYKVPKNNNPVLSKINALSISNAFHALIGEEVWITPQELKVKGFHYDFHGILEELSKSQTDGFKIHRIRENKHGCYTVIFEYDGKFSNKKGTRMFPNHYTPIQIATLVKEAAKNLITSNAEEKAKGPSWIIYGQVSNGMIIKFVVNKIKNGVGQVSTFYQVDEIPSQDTYGE